MASGQFFDPLTLLRVTPLVASSASLWLAVEEHRYLNIFLLLKDRSKVNEILPSYFEKFFYTTFPYLLSTFGITIATGVTNFYSRPNKALPWYAAGTALTLAHFAFVPGVMWKVKATIEAKPEPNGSGADEVKRWLAVHRVRSIFADFPAWACFFIAVLKSLKSI
ncbi:hypothetical protein F5B20DRAFT_580728 [Whalleya microplaca]|nr:hypothetical protein F5B20DRAFT_580728 [Whalleya microplaca]